MYSLHLVPEQLYTTEEVSEHLRLSLRTVQRLLQNKSLPAYKLHGQYRIKGLDLLTYLDQNRQDDQQLRLDNQGPSQWIDLLEVRPLMIQLGQAWLTEVTDESALIEELEQVRKQMVQELGFILPGVQFNDRLDLPEQGLCLLLHGVPVVQVSIDPQGHYLLDKDSLDRTGIYAHFHSVPQPAEGSLTGRQLLFQQLQAFIRRHAHEILSREEVAVILDRLRPQRGVVMDEVLANEPQPGKLTIGQLTQILRALLQEQVSIRNLGLILELLADALTETQRLEGLVEAVRQGLARQINAPLADHEGVIAVAGLQPATEARLQQALDQQDLPAQQQWFETLRQALRQHPDLRVLLCAPALRKTIYQGCNLLHPALQVMSYQEVAREFRLKLLTTLC
jgi:flagellar biosynthesis protein FlhA